MHFQIRHVTTYRYDHPVILGQHLFRMHPREDGLLSLNSFNLSINPPPAESSSFVDEEGNLTYAVRFEGLIPEFRVSVRTEGDTHPRIPGAESPPVKVESYLALYPETKAVLDFVKELSETSLGDPVVFLNLLNQRINQQVVTINRPTGAPLDPDQTLRDGKGSCRDLAVLFMACSRWQGIPARFVSGYFPAHPGDKQHMHAWAEAYLPETGWLAFDPTQGGEVGERHIAVAAAAIPAMATPITGFYIGQARSEMDIELSLDVLENSSDSSQENSQRAIQL